MTKTELKKQAKALAQNKLLAQILDDRRTELLEKWKLCPDPNQREQIWHGQDQLEKLAGAIDDRIKQHTRD